jgi:hypothetical protein
MALKIRCKRFCECGGEIHKVLGDGRIQYSPSNCGCPRLPGTPPSYPIARRPEEAVFINNSEDR